MSEQLVLLIVGAAITLLSSVILALFNRKLDNAKTISKLLSEVEDLKKAKSTASASIVAEFDRVIGHREARIIFLETSKQISDYFSHLGKRIIIVFSFVSFVIMGFSIIHNGLNQANLLNTVLSNISMITLTSGAIFYINYSVFIPITKLASRRNNIEYWNFDTISYEIKKNLSATEPIKNIAGRIVCLFFGNIAFFGAVFLFANFIINIVVSLDLSLSFDVTYSIAINGFSYVLGLFMMFSTVRDLLLQRRYF